MTKNSGGQTSPPRVIAFYLPQFHPIPENDEWWGKGFTEWRKVASARPLFRGHAQPDLPFDLGFYDLRVPTVRHEQWAMAEGAGLSGFCFYHYWFHGEQLLEQPVNDLVEDPDDDTPFMFCWANENWTRNWDGGPRELLKEQRYSVDDDRRHFAHLLRFFLHDRYIKHEGKPVFMVYRPNSHPDIVGMSRLWQHLAREAGLPGIHICGVEDPYGTRDHVMQPALSASVEFMPDPQQLPVRLRAPLHARVAGRLRLRENVYATHALYNYDEVVELALSRPLPSHPLYRCVTPSWDNTPRRPKGGRILIGATPEKYQLWLDAVVKQAREDETPFVFINAWNEWAEGAHLEPDMHRGSALLRATTDVLRGSA